MRWVVGARRQQSSRLRSKAVQGDPVSRPQKDNRRYAASAVKWRVAGAEIAIFRQGVRPENIFLMIFLTRPPAADTSSSTSGGVNEAYAGT